MCCNETIKQAVYIRPTYLADSNVEISLPIQITIKWKMIYLCKEVGNVHQCNSVYLMYWYVCSLTEVL